MKYLAPVLFSFLLVSGCSPSTSINKSWRDPQTQVKMGQFSKVLLVAFVKNPENRKLVEDEMVKLLKSKGVPSYQYLGEGNISLSEEELSKKILADGFDGAIVMQIIDPGKDLGYTPGTGTYPASYNSFSPYYAGASGKYYDDDYLKNHTQFAIETNMYSLKQSKLIWSGITTSVDPKNVNKLVADIGKVLTDEMKRQGFLY